MEIDQYLKTLVEKEASDVYLTVARPPMYRIEGNVQPVGDVNFSAADLDKLAAEIMNERQRKEFAANME
ncbi:MAG: type IV pili twitching motility protein PilT, partial [Candidatus Binatia bacterium]